MDIERKISKFLDKDPDDDVLVDIEEVYEMCRFNFENRRKAEYIVMEIFEKIFLAATDKTRNHENDCIEKTSVNEASEIVCNLTDTVVQYSENVDCINWKPESVFDLRYVLRENLLGIEKSIVNENSKITNNLADSAHLHINNVEHINWKPESVFDLRYVVKENLLCGYISRETSDA